MQTILMSTESNENFLSRFFGGATEVLPVVTCVLTALVLSNNQ